MALGSENDRHVERTNQFWHLDNEVIIPFFTDGDKSSISTYTTYT